MEHCVAGWQNEGNHTWNASSPLNTRTHTRTYRHNRIIYVCIWRWHPHHFVDFHWNYGYSYQHCIHNRHSSAKSLVFMPQFNAKMIMNRRFLANSACVLSWWATCTHIHKHIYFISHHAWDWSTRFLNKRKASTMFRMKMKFCDNIFFALSTHTQTHIHTNMNTWIHGNLIYKWYALDDAKCL